MYHAKSKKVLAIRAALDGYESRQRKREARRNKKRVYHREYTKRWLMDLRKEAA